MIEDTPARARTRVRKYPAVGQHDAHIFPPLLVGLDSLYVSYFLDGIGIDWEALAFAKECLRASGGDTIAETTLGGEQFALSRNGRKPYSYVLSNPACSLSLGEKIQPRCHAQFRSELLWKDGLDAALARLESLFARLGCKHLRPAKVSRADAAFDFRVETPDFSERDFLSQAAKQMTWREDGRLQTIQCGLSDVVCRVYDKVAEIAQASGKDWLFALWGCDSAVWRVEFQVRGERLKEAGIASLDQLRAHFPALVRALAEGHTSLRVPRRDTNKSRWPLHPLWRAVIASADRVTTPPPRAPAPLLTGTRYALHRQLQSLYGHLKSVDASLAHHEQAEPDTLEGLLKRLPTLLGMHHSPTLWRDSVAEKLAKRRLGL